MDQIVEKPQQDLAPAREAPRRRRRFPGLTFFVLILLAGGGLWVWTHRQPAQAPASGRSGHGASAQSVGVALVGKTDVPITFDGLGTVTALATVTVKTQIAGQLMEIGYTEGQIVKKGDFLAEVDPRPYQVALEQAQGALARDEALLKSAQVDLARYQKLNLQDSIARQQVDTQAALVQQDQGTIQTDKAQIDNAKLNLTYCHIVAPVDGRVGLRQVDAGNYVQTSDANGIVVITQLQPISVIFTQPEDRIPAIQQRLSAGATLPVSVYDRTGSKLITDGAVSTLDNQIDTTTGTAKLRAIFKNQDFALFPNQFVNTRLLLDTRKGATVVPSAAIQVGTPGTYVYRVNADDTVSVTPIKVGQVSGDVTEVTSGLVPGDRVVIDGIDRLHDGAKVRIPADTPHHDDGAAGRGSDAQNGKPEATRPEAAAPAGAAPVAAADPQDVAGGQKPKHRHRHDQPDAAAAAPASAAAQPAAQP